MKKLFLSLSLLACITFFNACSTNVELYADYKDIPIVYGLIDATKDINYVRINRAFSSSNDHHINAHEVALIADSCNYPGKLDARIIEYRTGFGNQYVPTGRVFVLDTMTIHDKDTGVFYAPHQKVYYTNEPINVNTNGSRYKYRLVINKDNDSITAETGVVGGGDFRIITAKADFAANPQPINSTSRISFKTADNAVFYDIKMAFHYKEKRGDVWEDKQVNWNFGSKSLDELNYDDQQKCYYVTYQDISLFTLLEDAIGNDLNVTRAFDLNPIEIMIAAGGDELYNYIQVNAMAGGLSQTVPDYTNVTGGYGVFSSRINKTKSISLTSRAQVDLFSKPWGFITQ
ncbi:MAG: DUF4249 family protein [Bacteroidales bacterium]|nr:DUF4249 family protein [Bacteroidales bacterium]